MNREEEMVIVLNAQTNIHAFDKLYQYYVTRIYSYIFYRTSNKEVAEDITSAVFLQACQKIQMFDISKGFRFSAWLYQVAHNKMIDYFRRNKKFKVNVTNFDEEKLGSEKNTGEQEVELSYKQKQIADVLLGINERYQHIISLKFF
ncbi:MAG: sigma-70 family RNA polymerase sigma factor [Candidatus Dojkabacteria bacterium]|nr:sigma-70 family RNA polymerase sigma factor [Candidatus Dojkabacteria bacterium]MDQ7020616.1 sigma-70 family RNA polymerase sigma factor [Candidatus Dojkabacteria bacterium]